MPEAWTDQSDLTVRTHRDKTILIPEQPLNARIFVARTMWQLTAHSAVN